MPLSILLHKCWLERLEDCCQHCGELNIPHDLGNMTLDCEKVEDHTKTFEKYEANIERNTPQRYVTNLFMIQCLSSHTKT